MRTRQTQIRRTALTTLSALTLVSGCAALETLVHLPEPTEPPSAPPQATSVVTAEPLATPTDTVPAGNEASPLSGDLAFATDRPAEPGSYHEPVYTGSGVDFGGDYGVRSQDVTTVGLFGEFTTEPVPSPGRFDGAGNLMQITNATEGAVFDPDIDRRGRMLAFASTQHRHTADIYVKAVEGRTMTQITADPADDVMPAIAPDGNRIAFASNRAGNWDLFWTNINGDPAVQLTFDTAHELHPSWSPDGKSLVYCKLGAQSGRWELWLLDVEDAAAPRFLEYGLFPQWNPDPTQNKIVFQRARERGSRLFSIWTIDLVHGESRHPTEIVSAANAAAMHPAWSPDGWRIVFVTVVDPDRQPAGRPREADVWAIDQLGKQRMNLTNGKFLNLYPIWGADGAVYFLSDRSGVDNIWAVASTGTTEFGRPDVPLVTADPDVQTDQENP